MATADLTHTEVKTQVKRIAKQLIRPLTHRWQTRASLVADLRQLGITQGGCLFVHSSFSSLGYVRGGTGAVLEALKDSVGPDGTLVLPSHSWLLMNEGCREFDVRSTPTCVGALPAAFVDMPGVVRSLHPTHSVAARGPLAEDLVVDHHLAETPCGAKTPYERMLTKGGQILFLGASLASNTAFHTVEAIANLPYLMERTAERFEITDYAGQRFEIDIHLHRQHIPRRFAEMKDLLVEQGIARTGHVGAAPSVLISGRPFLDFMTALLKEQPEYLLAERDG